MSTNSHSNGRPRNRRSAAQREGSAAMILVMETWEGLNDDERRAWRIEGAHRRMKGVNYFKQVNLRRVRRGAELARRPLRYKPGDAKPLLKGVDIRNRAGRFTLELELYRVPDGPYSVWASLPCDLGLQRPRECPRLGGLPAPQRRWSEIGDLYFNKHGQYIKRHGLQLVGKRIFVRLRRERDEGVQLYEQAEAVVPPPEVQIRRKGPSSSKEVRRSFEGGSKVVRNITVASKQQRASHTPAASH